MHRVGLLLTAHHLQAWRLCKKGDQSVVGSCPPHKAAGFPPFQHKEHPTGCTPSSHHSTGGVQGAVLVLKSRTAQESSHNLSPPQNPSPSTELGQDGNNVGRWGPSSPTTELLPGCPRSLLLCRRCRAEHHSPAAEITAQGSVTASSSDHSHVPCLSFPTLPARGNPHSLWDEAEIGCRDTPKSHPGQSVGCLELYRWGIQDEADSCSLSSALLHAVLGSCTPAMPGRWRLPAPAV